MANTWNTMGSAPDKRPVWVISMDCAQPTPFLATFSQIQFSKLWAWQICNSRSQITPTHWREIDVPEIPK